MSVPTAAAANPWDSVAEVSDAFAVSLGQANDKFIELGKLFAGAMVLDVGCGTGMLSAKCGALVGKDGRVIGIDTSKAMIDLAKQRNAAAANIQLSVHDAHVLKLPDASCDVVYCQLGLPFFDDPERFLRRALAVLKPGGRLVLMVVGSRDHNDFFGVVAPVAESRLVTAMRLGHEADLKGVLEKVGFEEARTRPVRAACKIIDAAGYWNMMRGTLGIADPTAPVTLLSKLAPGTPLSMEIVFALGRKPDPSVKRQAEVKEFHDVVSAARHGIRELTAIEAKRNLRKQEVRYVDVREPKEWTTGIIPDALRIPRGDLEQQIGQHISDPNTPIVAYSEDGQLSTMAVVTLSMMGYRNVWNLYGGLRDWIKDGMPVDKKPKL